MSYDSLLKDAVRVYTQADESDTWTRVAGAGDVRCRITALSASGARRESAEMQPEVTHVLSCRPNTHLTAGVRLRHVRTRAEYMVRSARSHDDPRPGGRMVCGLVAVEAAIT